MVLLIASPLPSVCPSIFRWRLSPGRFISRGEDRICLGRPVPKNPLSLSFSLFLSLWTRLTARRESVRIQGPGGHHQKLIAGRLGRGGEGRGGRGASVDRWRRWWKEERGSGRSIARPSPLCPNNVTNNLIRLSQTPL